MDIYYIRPYGAGHTLHVIGTIGCSNPTASDPEDSEEPASVEWPWAGGRSTRVASGLYIEKNEPNAANVPGARNSAASWSDESGNLWLFRGFGYDSGGNLGRLSDLWRFAP